MSKRLGMTEVLVAQQAKVDNKGWRDATNNLYVGEMTLWPFCIVKCTKKCNGLSWDEMSMRQKKPHEPTYTFQYTIAKVSFRLYKDKKTPISMVY